MINDALPRRNLPAEAENWGRQMEVGYRGLGKDLVQVREALDNVTRRNSGALASIRDQLLAVSGQQEILASQQAILLTMQARHYTEFASTLTGTAGWYASPCSVDITSGTGRIEIGYGGTANGGDVYFAYSVMRLDSGAVLVNRDSIIAGVTRRVAVTGGASFTPSGYRTQPLDVPSGIAVRVNLEVYGLQDFAYIFGGSISARVVA